MSWIAYIIVLAFTGLVVGGLGRLVIPGRDPMTIPQTIIVGLAGSMLAGVLARALFGGYAPGLVLSVACSAVIVYVVRRVRGGALGGGPRRPPLRR